MTAVREDAPSTSPPTYAHLLSAARRLFQPDELERLIPRLRGGPRLSEVNGEGIGALDPIAATEAIAYDFLAKGGKYSRPFITLAAYDALTGGHCTRPNGDQQTTSRLTNCVRRAAVSIESFHKASLVHDDIQDGDAFRYGEPTLHIEHGVPTAINVGDYLIGLGYRVVTRDVQELGADIAADLLNKLADAHTKLSEGQGAELVWRAHARRGAHDLRAQNGAGIRSRLLLRLAIGRPSPAFGARRDRARSPFGHRISNTQ
jgi:hypothetical protein